MTSRGRLMTILFCCLATGGLGAVGCGSDSASDSSGGKPAGFCGASSALSARCADTPPSECDTKIAEVCDGALGVLSPSLTDAAAECVAAAACGTSPASCLGQSIAKVQPTDAQKKLAEAYCSSCAAVGGDTCTQAFLGAGGEPSVLSKLISPMSDTLAAAIEDACIGITCKATFTTCAQGVIAKQVAAALTADSAKCLVQALTGAASGSSDGGEAGAPPACTPKTCADLPDVCGVHSDECGGSVDCGTCAPTATCEDPFEPNNVVGAASDLGTFYDFPSSSQGLNGLLADGDEDWYQFEVRDYGFGGNPTIQLTPTENAYEISLWFKCYSGGDASTCQEGTTPDTSNGVGCRAAGAIRMSTECSGTTEDGLALARVRKVASDGTCKPYSLSLVVD